MSVISEVGCKKCGRGGEWSIFTDGEQLVQALCQHCGNRVELKDLKLKTEPDPKQYDPRMFT